MEIKEKSKNEQIDNLTEETESTFKEIKKSLVTGAIIILCFLVLYCGYALIKKNIKNTDETYQNMEEQTEQYIDNESLLEKMYPESIIVEKGDDFILEYWPKNVKEPFCRCREITETGELDWSKDIAVKGYWDPGRGYSPHNEEQGFQTFVAREVGTFYICDPYQEKNLCKVTVVEKTMEEKEEIQNDVNTQKNSVNGNKAECEIIVKNNLPEEFKYTSSFGKWYSSCKVHKADVIQKNGNVLIQLLCEKTFDEKNGASAECYIVWKLYDDQNIVVDSGRVSKHNISVNEMFTETIHIFKDLAPKKYILEFSELQL